MDYNLMIGEIRIKVARRTSNSKRWHFEKVESLQMVEETSNTWLNSLKAGDPRAAGWVRLVEAYGRRYQAAKSLRERNAISEVGLLEREAELRDREMELASYGVKFRELELMDIESTKAFQLIHDQPTVFITPLASML